MLLRDCSAQAILLGSEEHGCAARDLSLEELDQKDQDYRADPDHNQRPSNIIMLRMLPPNATGSEVGVHLYSPRIRSDLIKRFNAFSSVDPGTTSGARDPAQRGSPHEEQIFR